MPYYNPDCDFCDNCYEHGHEAEDCPQPDMTEKHLQEEKDYNLKYFGANTVTPWNFGTYMFCDAEGNTRVLGWWETKLYKWGYRKAEDFKI